jgi:NAD(P)-dependent dehydrogenase (short-subunit alcohol dehydrogenase family)
MDPAGRHALVTGGGRGKGLAIARAPTQGGAAPLRAVLVEGVAAMTGQEIAVVGGEVMR